MNDLRILLKMQIQIQMGWGGAQDSVFLTNAKRSQYYWSRKHNLSGKFLKILITAVLQN